MTDGPFSITTELNLAGSWVDVSGDVYNRDSMQITRGRADEGSQVDPGKCTFTLNNRDGKYSPRNPLSPYYGLIGRNTPVRVSVDTGTPHLELDGDPTGTASTPDHASLDITSQIDIRCEAAIDWHRPGNSQVLVAKWDAATNNKSYMLRVYQGSLWFSWTTDGINNLNGFWSLPYLPRRAAVRATFNGNDAGNIVARFYWATSIDDAWTLLGEVTAPGTSTIFSGSAPLTLGGGDAGTTPPRTPAIGTIYAAEVRSAVDGPVVSRVDTTTPTITDTTGKVWTVNGTAQHSTKTRRFVGEISSWPSRWASGGEDVYTPVEASGILRRLGQGVSPLQSPMRREFGSPSRTDIVAYWPLEDGEDATSFASAISDAPAMTIKGDVKPAAFDDYPASEALPFLNTGTLNGNVPSYTTTGQTALRMFVNVAGAPGSPDRSLLELRTNGTAERWEVLRQATTHNLVLKAYDGDSNVLVNLVLAQSISNQSISLGVDLTQNGSNIDYRLYFVDADFLVWSVGGTLNSRTVGRVTSVSLGNGDGNQSIAVGHVALATNTDAWSNTADAMNSWDGEFASNRVSRLADEEGLSMVVTDPYDDAAQAGPQTFDTVLDIMQNAADADMGFLYEQRDAFGLAYRAQGSLYNQPAALTLDSAADQVAPPLEPTDDDQTVRNDITVTREGGASWHVVEETGPMSVAEPPVGIGRYVDDITLNVSGDDQLPDIAGWKLHLGTWDEARYPVIRVNLLASPELIPDAASVDIGDRIVIDNPPAWLPPDPIDQLVQGYTETLSLYEWSIEYNCSPARPWVVANTDDEDVTTGLDGSSRVDTDGSVLATSAGASDVTLFVATTDGPLWTTDAADWPFDIAIGGERITVNAVGELLNANTTFESNVTGWTPFGGGTLSWSTERAYVGKGSAKLTTTGAASPRFEAQSVPVTVGRQYRATGWVYVDAALPSTLSISVNWYTSATAYISTSSNNKTMTPGQWMFFDATYTAPANAAKAGILVSCAGTPAAGIHVWGDMVQLTSANGDAIVNDTFTRTVSSGWGSADTGQAWAMTGGSASDFSTNGTTGKMSAGSVNVSRFGAMNTVSFADVDMRADISVPVVATGNDISTGLRLRAVDGSNYYYVEVVWETDSTVYLQLVSRVAGVTTVIDGPIPMGTYAANSTYTVRGRIIGDKLQAKLWELGDLEPGNWALTATTTAITATAPVGLRTILSSGNTNTLPVVATFDNVRVLSPQRFSVVRGANGITKSHSAGEDVRLADPAIISL